MIEKKSRKKIFFSSDILKILCIFECSSRFLKTSKLNHILMYVKGNFQTKTNSCGKLHLLTVEVKHGITIISWNYEANQLRHILIKHLSNSQNISIQS